MRFHCAVVAATFLFAPIFLRGQSPDDRYVHIYSLIEEADKLTSSGQFRPALTKYLEARTAIKELQHTYPDWSPKLVTYRLEYVSSRLEPLAQKQGDAPPPAAGNSHAESAAPAQPMANELKGMQDRIDRLNAQNALLEAKLREALTVQPAAVDPRELARAEEKIKQLQKERDLLTVTLEQRKEKGSLVGANRSSDSEREQAPGPNGQSITQTPAVSALQNQNEDLRKQIAYLSAKVKGSSRPTRRNSDTLALKETIAALEASNRVLKEEQAAMEERLLAFVKQHGASAPNRDGALEKQLAEARQQAKTAAEERDALAQKLNAKQLTQREPRTTNTASQELEKELEVTRARLQVFEAKPVPYSAEELALFKQGSTKVVADQTSVPVNKKKSREVPPGAGPLVAEAMRATDGGQFDEAEKKYRDVLRQDQNNVYILANLAAVQMEQEKASEAEATLKRALEIDSQDAASLFLMGSLKLRQEKYDEALEALSLSAKVDPEKAQTQYFLGRALIQKGNRGAAETALRKAIQLKPGWGDAHYQLAVLYATQQPNFKELAMYHYKKAIAGGAPRNLELEKWMEKTATASKH